MITLFITASIACCSLSAASANAQDHHGSERAQAVSKTVNAMCPVGKEPIVPSAGTVEYKGNQIGTCCPGCGKQFLAWDEARKDEFVALAAAHREPGHDQHRVLRTPASSAAVEQIGNMRDVMRGGQTGARVRLSTIPERGSMIAVGALEGLGGEITVLDGAFWVTRAIDGVPSTTGPSVRDGDAATLLARASVPAWSALEISGEGRTLAELVLEGAAVTGLELNEPFPFVIEGVDVQMDLHVINGFCTIGQDPGEIDASPWRWSGNSAKDVRIVGFFARDRAGEMTHHGTEIHAHAIATVDGQIVTAHVDHASVTGAATLRLPAARVDNRRAKSGKLEGGIVVAPNSPYTLPDCPVGGPLGSMGDPIVMKFDGREVRFCCESCIGKFEADQAGYWEKIDSQIIADQLRYYPTETCVVSGEPLMENGEDIANDMVYGNRLVRLCCQMCERQFMADPKKYIEKLDKAVAEEQRKDYPLDSCIVAGGKLGSMGEPVEMVVSGRLMRFCCASCEPMVAANPGKYTKLIDEAWQGKGMFMPE